MRAAGPPSALGVQWTREQAREGGGAISGQGQFEVECDQSLEQGQQGQLVIGQPT